MIKELLKNKYIDCNGSIFEEEQILNFAQSTSYLCRMYWMQRTDKIFDGDYEFYRQLTNELLDLKEQDKLQENFVPKYGDDVLFAGIYSHKDLENKLIDGIYKSLKEEISKPKEKKGFLNRFFK